MKVSSKLVTLFKPIPEPNPTRFSRFRQKFKFFSDHPFIVMLTLFLVSVPVQIIFYPSNRGKMLDGHYRAEIRRMEKEQEERRKEAEERKKEEDERKAELAKSEATQNESKTEQVVSKKDGSRYTILKNFLKTGSS